MNKTLKRILIGFIPWGIPFLTSFLVWDTTKNAPSVGLPWFYALMAITGSIGFGLAAFLWFRKIRKDTIREGWITGITWYVQAVIMDLLILVMVFGMSTAEYYPLLITYLNFVVLGVSLGYIIKK